MAPGGTKIATLEYFVVDTARKVLCNQMAMQFHIRASVPHTDSPSGYEPVITDTGAVNSPGKSSFLTLCRLRNGFRDSVA
jgi:hypothetical protein